MLSSNTPPILYNVQKLKGVFEFPKSAVIQYNTGIIYATTNFLIKISTDESQQTSYDLVHSSKCVSCVCRGSNGDELYVGGDILFKYKISSGETESISAVSCNHIALDPFRKYLYFVTDSNGIVIRHSLLNGKSETYTEQFKVPYSVTVDSLGNLYVADKDFIKVIEFQEGKQFQKLPTKVFLDLSTPGKIDDEYVDSFPLGLTTDIWNDDIYFAQYNKHLISKISSNKILTTVAGTKEGISNCGTLSNECKFNYCRSVDLDINGDIYVSDRDNCRICKFIPITNNRLKKYENDKIGNLNIIGTEYVIKHLLPSMYSLLTSNAITSQLNAKRFEIIQNLIDSLIYKLNDFYWYLNYEIIDIIIVLSLIEDIQFITLKNRMITKLVYELNNSNCIPYLEQVLKWKEIIPNSQMLNNIYEYLCAKIAELMQTDKDLIQTNTVQNQILQIVKNYSTICFAKLKSIPLLKQDSIPQFPNISTLYNDESTSDIIIKIGNSKTIFGHKSILSSNSSYFETLFQIGEQFKDLQNNTYQIECDEFDETLHELVIKYCYEIFDFNQKHNSIELLKCASFYNLTKVMDYCVENIELNVDNVENMKSELEFIQHTKLTMRIDYILSIKNQQKH